MTAGSKSGWVIASLYAAATVVGMFGWVGLVVGFILLSVAIVCVGFVKSSKQQSEREAKLPTKTCSVSAGQRCPLCHADFEAEEVVETCAGCETLYHQGCREEWRVCATLGCRKRKRTLRSQGGLFRVSKNIKPRVKATPKVRRKIQIRRDPSSGALEVPRDEPVTIAEPQSASPEQVARAAQRVLKRRVAS